MTLFFAFAGFDSAPTHKYIFYQIKRWKNPCGDINFIFGMNWNMEQFEILIF